MVLLDSESASPQVRSQVEKEVEQAYGRPMPALAADFDFCLKFTLASLAKNHNHLGGLDRYMRELATIVDSTAHVRAKATLEQVMNSEVAVLSSYETFSEFVLSKEPEPTALHHGVIGQPDFEFLSAPEKLSRVREYHANMSQLKNVGEVKFFLSQALNDTQQRNQLLNNFSEVSQMLEKAQISEDAPVERFHKASSALNNATEVVIAERLGIEGIRLDNLEQIYNPANSGVFSILENRDNFVRKGMGQELADELAMRYIQIVEARSMGAVYTLFDAFSTSSKHGSEAVRNLQEQPWAQIALNYETSGELRARERH
jgi:hypothetical protein